MSNVTVTAKLAVKLPKTYTAKGATEPTKKNRLVGYITLFSNGSGVLELNHTMEKYTLLPPFVKEGEQPKALAEKVQALYMVKLRKSWVDKATGEERSQLKRVGAFVLFTSGYGTLDLNFTSDSYAVFPPFEKDAPDADDSDDASDESSDIPM